MELRNWVQDRFGTADTESLLDESVYSQKELRKDKTKLEQSMKQVEKEMEKHQRKYEKLMQKGAEADEMKRKQYAQKAKFEKKKYTIKKQKHKQKSVKLGTIISIEGMREVMDMQSNEADITLTTVLNDEMNAQELQGQVMEQMAEFGLEMEDMKEVQEALDVEILDQELQTEEPEELELMEEMAAGEMSSEQIDIEEEVNGDTETDDIDIDIEQNQTL
ncbi:hypothetical protein DM826_02105 [Halonotius aquaticus]|uniref:Uncharacterized protein n=1 Tax=Halonotius aquaticus TaxID=2216978 RepID=A0A3A6PQC1_9EURY|nr:hypothetical protein [Halonotius aquaticus]RJX44433.1 hypothetical protein DM826_02105 [Halonotius aquaticus]